MRRKGSQDGVSRKRNLAILRTLLSTLVLVAVAVYGVASYQMRSGAVSKPPALPTEKEVPPTPFNENRHPVAVGSGEVVDSRFNQEQLRVVDTTPSLVPGRGGAYELFVAHERSGEPYPGALLRLTGKNNNFLGHNENALRTGPSGIVHFAVEKGREHSLLVEGKGFPPPSTVEALPPVQDGQVVRVTIVLPSPETMATFNGVVRDVDSLQPISTAVVRFYSEMWQLGPQSTTDGEGHFTVDLLGRSSHVFIVAERAGYAASLTCINLHELGTSPISVSLGRPATLLLRDPPPAFSSARVEANYIAACGSTHRPWPGAKIQWGINGAQIDENGEAVIEGVSPKMGMRINLLNKKGDRWQYPWTLHLASGESRQLSMAAAPGQGTICGELLLEGCADSAQGTAIWLVPVGDASEGATLLREEHRDIVACEVHASAAGYFCFENVPAGSWWVGVAPSSPGEDNAPSPVARKVTVSLEDPRADVSIQASCGLFIHGAVLDRSGDAVPRASLFVEALDLNAYTKEDGSFSLGPVHAGAYEVLFFAEDRCELSSISLEIQAGGQPALVTLPSSAVIAGTLVDQNGRPQPGRVRFINIQRPAVTVPALAGPSGTFVCCALPPGNYRLHATGAAGGVAFEQSILVTEGQRIDGLSVILGPHAELHLVDADPKIFVVIRREGIVVGVADAESPVAMVPPGAVDLYFYSANTPPSLVATQSTMAIAGVRSVIQAVDEPQ